MNSNIGESNELANSNSSTNGLGISAQFNLHQISQQSPASSSENETAVPGSSSNSVPIINTSGNVNSGNNVICATAPATSSSTNNNAVASTSSDHLLFPPHPVLSSHSASGVDLSSHGGLFAENWGHTQVHTTLIQQY